MASTFTGKTFTLPDTNKEAHMVGSYVGVCWNIRGRNEVRTIIGADGLTYTATVEIWERYGNPYIDFLTICEDTRGQFYEDDDSPVQGGLNIDLVLQLITELQDAIKYIQYLQGSI